MSDKDQLEKAKQNYTEASRLLIQIQCSMPIERLFTEIGNDPEPDNLREMAGDALEYINAALKVSPKNPEYLNTKGLLVANGLGRVKDGLKLLRKALELEPDNITIKQNIRKLEKGLAEENIRERQQRRSKRIQLAIYVSVGILMLLGLIINNSLRER